jgi:hypothetical protein
MVASSPHIAGLISSANAVSDAGHKHKSLCPFVIGKVLVNVNLLGGLIDSLGLEISDKISFSLFRFLF